jgi:2-polyprenyl-6-methoxyphenol hydroxylase-like FAD-dependent oxidoreductase
MSKQARPANDDVTQPLKSGASEYDVAIVGASLAGCAAAIAYGRAGLSVALLEKRPDPAAYKRICTHYIQASAVGSIERLGLLEPILAEGAQLSRLRLHTPVGWIEPPLKSRVPSGVNLRRERLDPLIRRVAADTPGVELMLGQTVEELVRDGDAVTGLKARDAHGATLALRARLVVGADGRGSEIAKLAALPTKKVQCARFAYGGYFEGPAPMGAPDSSLWLLDPDMAAVFPTDSDLYFYACMPVKDRLPAFREDPQRALLDIVSGVPDAPPIEESRLVGQVQGKLDMTNVAHRLTAPGLALTGDAALAIDPLWGVGCGWAFQSSEWMTDSTIPALRGEEPLMRGLERYRRRHARKLRGHKAMIYDYTRGRKINFVERNLFAAARYDQRVSEVFEEFGTRSIGPARMFARMLPRVAYLQTRRRLTGRRPTPGGTTAGAEASGA